MLWDTSRYLGFLFGSKPERNKLKIDINNVKALLVNEKFDEALAIWPSIETQVTQVLAERDPLPNLAMFEVSSS